MATGEPPPCHPPHEVDDKQPLNPPQPRPQATNNSFPKPQPNHPSFSKSFSKHRIHVDASHLQPTYLQVAQGANRSTVSPTSQEQQSVLDFEDIPLKPISMYLGKPSVVFPLSEKISLVDKLQFVLVGKFSHGMPSLNHIRRFFSSLKLHKSCNVTLFDKKHIFIECFCKADYIFIWLHLSWIIEGFRMRVLKWSAEFSPRNESATVPVWVRLEGLPLYMFDERSLLAIGNCIGKPIKVDPRNVDRTIVHSARICVELDVSKPLLDSLWVSFEDDVTKVVMEGFMVKVRFEEVPPYCGFCYHIGHSYSTCKRREESGVQEIGVVQERQDKGASKNVQIAGHLGSETGIHMDTNSSNSGTQHMAVLTANGSFQHIDTYGKGMNQIEGMLVKTLIQTPQPGLHHSKQTSGELEQIEEEPPVEWSSAGDSAAGVRPSVLEYQGVGAGKTTAQEGLQSGAEVRIWTESAGIQKGWDEGAEIHPLVKEVQGVGGVIQNIVSNNVDAKCNKYTAIQKHESNDNSQQIEVKVDEELNAGRKQIDVKGDEEPTAGRVDDEFTAVRVDHEMEKEEGEIVEGLGLLNVDTNVDPSTQSWADLVAEEQVQHIARSPKTNCVAEFSPCSVAKNTKAGGHSWAVLVEKEEEHAGSNTQSWADLAKEEQVQHLATYAIEEIEMLMATPTRTYSIFEETVPNTCNASILDLEGSPVPCSEIIRNSARIADVRKHFQFLSNEKFVETLVEQGKYEEVIKEAMIKYTKEIRRTFLDHAKSIYPKVSTTEKDTSQTQEVIPKVSTVDEKEWSTPKRRGKNRNRS